jgi:hypothetical protein
VTWFAWHGFNSAVQESNDALTEKALKSNQFAADFAARNAAYELERRYNLVEQVAASDPFRRQLANALSKPEFRALLASLSDPKLGKAEQEVLRKQFRNSPVRRVLQDAFAEAIPISKQPNENDGNEEVASWFFCDANGLSTARVPDRFTVGKNYAWRSYFYGGPGDKPQTWRPKPGEHLQQTNISDVFQSQASARWIVAISTPVFDNSPEKKFLGVIAMTVEVNRLLNFPGGSESQFAVLVDNRLGDHQGVILQHPLFDKMQAASQDQKLPGRFQLYQVGANDLPNRPDREEDYHDPLAIDDEGGYYNQQWLAEMQSIQVRKQDTGWIVIVQESYESAIGTTLKRLTRDLIRSGAIALCLIAFVMAAMWGMAKRMSTVQRD